MKKNSGQVLLITVMLLATVLTVVIAVTFKSRTDTQTTKLEQESQKALAAAEAAIEEAIRSNSTATLGSGSLSTFGDLSGSATIDTSYALTYFVSPAVQADQAYTFYLDSFDPSTGFSNNPASYYSGNLAIYYDSNSGGCNNMALEISLYYGSGSTYNVKRFIADTGDKFGASATDDIGSATSGTVDTTTFNCRALLSGADAINNTTYPDIRFMVVRSMYAGTKLGFVGGSSAPGTVTLRPQGRTVVSEAKTSTGVTKKVQLFQSYPQIPQEFLVTSF